jgi:predicted RNase H-like HicB family nuclease
MKSPEGATKPGLWGQSTQAETMDELREMVRDAVKCHFEENSTPRVIRLHMVKDEEFPA